MAKAKTTEKENLTEKIESPTEIKEEISDTVKEFKEPNEVKSHEESKTSSEPVKTGPTYDELLSLVQQLAGEVQALKSSQPVQSVQSTDKTDKILELLANRKSDREVVIVHNCEMFGGLSTHIELTGLIIDFHTLGEQRLLSWQQFEECVSKYRTFFERQIILLADNEEEIGARYNIPCVKRGNNHILTHSDIENLSKLDVRALEDFINTLTDNDKDFVLSYWLGKCYNREAGFYDRYKIEMLNNLFGMHVFDNLLTLMNGDFRNEENN